MIKKKIKDIGKVVLGSTPSTDEEKQNYGGGFPFVRPADMEHSKRFVEGTKKTLSDNGKEVMENKILPENAIMISRRGTIGYTAITEHKVATNGGILSVIPDEEYDTNYLYYKFTSDKFISQLKMLGQGSTHPHVTKRDFENMEVEIHPPSEQEKIGEILSNIDKKIEVNREISELLEETARAIYESWFVEFEPYKEEYDFLSTELGPIPEHFEIKQLGEIAELKYGDGLTEKERDDGGVPVYGSSGITDTHSTGRIKPPVVITGRKGTLGKVHLENREVWPIDTTFYVNEFHYGSPEFVYLLLDSCKFERFNEDAAVPGLNKNTAESQNVALPPEAEIERFTARTKPMFKKIHLLRDENAELEELRDYLLPILLSGAVSPSIE